MLTSTSSTLPLDQTPIIQHDVSASNLSAAQEEFRPFLESDAVITDPDECLRRSSNPWSKGTPEQKPAIVLLPLTTEHVSRIMKICSTRRIPVTSFSGGTSVPGSLISTRGGVCLDFQRMNKITHINTPDMDATVEPGVSWKQLDSSLRRENFFFPPDPSPEACIGGMIAMSAAGTNAYRYGTMKEWVISLTVVLADGSVVRTRRRPRKSSAGYDLTHLIIGSEGTLGLVTEAVLKIAPVQSNLHVAVSTFANCHAAVRVGVKLANQGYMFDALEMLCDRSMRNINRSGLSPKRRWKEETTLFLKMSGSQSNVDALRSAAEKAAAEENTTSFESTGEPEQIDILWSGRKITAKASLVAKKDPFDLWIHSDAAVPLSRLADIIEFAYARVDEEGFEGSVTGHIGDGNFHLKIICGPEREEAARKIMRDVAHAAIEMDGTISGEHGIGLEGRDALVHELGQTSIDAMRNIKLALDPLCILNCDKVIRLAMP